MRNAIETFPQFIFRAWHGRKIAENIRLLKFGVISRVSRAKSIIILVLFCGLAGFAGATELYHTNRVFNKVSFTIPGVPTAFEVYNMAGQLTSVVGPTNVITNSFYAKEQMSVVLGHESSAQAWAAAVVGYPTNSCVHSNQFYDNAGWIKGLRLTEDGKWGGYIWVMQNTVNFKTSATNIWVSTNGVTNFISKVLVGTIGDFGPMEDKTDTGPALEGLTNNPPAGGQSNDMIYTADLTAYYELTNMPSIWIEPLLTNVCVNYGNVNYKLSDNSIAPNGVYWSITPTNGVTLTPYSTTAVVNVGGIATGYVVRATANDNTNIFGSAVLNVLKVEIKSIEFTSDHGLLTDYNTDYAGSGGTVYNPRGWIKGGANNPITHVKDNKITANVTLCVQPSGISFNLTGDGPIGALDFHKTGLTSSGSDQTISVTSDEKLPVGIDVLNNSINWSINVGGQTYGNESSGPHKIYVTWDSLGSGPTLKRIDKVCNTADGQNSAVGIADSLQDMVASETTFGSGDVDGWALLDGGNGDCDNQARCMKYTFEMPGTGSANIQFVRASSNAGQGNCLDLESRVVSNQTQYLVMDFDTGGGYSWNAYEGCCEAAGYYYAITPKKKASHDYGMLQALGCQQYWVRTTALPGSTNGWSVIEIIEEVPIP